MKKNYLELVRGGAAILVLITHLVMLHPVLNKMGLNFISNWGTESVMIFFILSGIVINLSQTHNSKSNTVFIVNRIVRLYPQFLIGIILSLIAFTVLTLKFPDIYDLLGNIFMVSTLQGYLATVFKTNSPIWSLTFEMFFYILFAISIGKQKKIFLSTWFFCSLIAMFSFSSIWLVGYYVYEYREKFYVDIYSALISLSVLPIVSRLNLSVEYFDPFKFFLFAIVSIPFFRYALQEKNTGRKISLGIMPITYLLLVVFMFYNSEALVINQYFYAGLPLLVISVYLALKYMNARTYVKEKLFRIGNISGKYSYSLYIIHFPILMIMANWQSNPFIFLMFSLIIIISIVYIMENYIQKNISLKYKNWQAKLY